MFNFKLATFFRNTIIEDTSSVNAMFQILVTLVNDQYSSMSVNIDVESYLRRYCGSNFKERSTILDIVIIVFLLLSLVTYVISVCKTCKLAMVYQ